MKLKIDLGGRTQTKWTIIFSLGIFAVMLLQVWKMGRIQPELFDFAKWLWGGLVIRNTLEGVAQNLTNGKSRDSERFPKPTLSQTETRLISD